ncbi:methyl-accepting chemotaxis protein [Massilia sp. 2TAF26]|uniref:methyl-accepting chemotaxis protein n=1 Tax=Massilia sp. 2TAF26 TaxID=3233012 RepID=UPI003F96E470
MLNKLTKQLTIKTRLILVIVLLGLELIVGATVGLLSLGHANDQLHSLYDDRMVCLGQLDRIVRRLNLNQLAAAEALNADPGAVPALLENIARNKVFIDEQWKAYSGTRMTEREKELAAGFVRARGRFVGEALQPAVEALRARDMERAKALVQGPMIALFVPVRTAVDGLIQLQLDEAGRASTESQSTYEIVRLVCLGGMAFGLVLAGVVGAMLIRGIVVPLEEAVRVAGAVAGGDLTQSIAVTAQDETGRLMRALNEMNRGLASLVGRVRGGTDTIATASGQIAAGNLDLSSRTEEQAASLEQTASSMEELTATVRQNADNARQANALALSASEVANRGGAVVAEVVGTMGAIDASATRIADIIGVIDGIAFQTNILALNAAVEAARAGEQGRGFAVVAGEVRNLAQRSAAAAREIKALIDDSVRQVRHGSTLVDRAGSTMQEIVGSVGRVTGIMGDIMAASQEQAAGIEQVNQAIAQMDQATQQNAALVEQASAAAQALREEADSLAAAVQAFRLNGSALQVPQRLLDAQLHVAQEGTALVR